MKITLALVLVSLSAVTVAKPGFVRERKHQQHHHHNQCATRNTTHTGSTTHPAATHPVTTPNPGTTPNSEANPYQGTTTHSVSHANSVSYTSSATSPAATTPSSGGWVQNPSGKASFTAYSGCQAASCGQKVNGYSAAVNELAFGANSAAGGACGRCFKITPTYDPYTPSYAGPFGNSIVVKANDLCPAGSNNQWCGQRVSNPLNSFNMPMHFDLCTDSGAPNAFFPGERRAMLGTYEEVSCSEWSGTDGDKLWNGSCLAGENAGLWPATGCSNTGTPPA